MIKKHIIDYLIDANTADRLSNRKGWRTLDEISNELGINKDIICNSMIALQIANLNCNIVNGLWFLEMKKPEANKDPEKDGDYFVFRLVPKKLKGFNSDKVVKITEMVEKYVSGDIDETKRPASFSTMEKIVDIIYEKE